ncbi:MAG: methionine adenosyltransferase [Gemmatimonadales bacterium]|nr:MAG: methionine adenosyltransferase [Gemmatimonadales bacterium]
MSERLFTSESVTEGHPDKVADRVSDSILDHILAEDPNARVACETLVTTGLVLIAGEITTETYAEIPDIVRATLKEIGYSDPEFGIDSKTCAVLTTIDRQAPEIAQGVDPGGAGDQGMMFGYASDETDAHMPAPIQYSHQLTRRLAELRHSGALPWLRPDGKAQVTVAYEDDRPVRIDTVVVSAQHSPDVSRAHLEEGIREEVIAAVLPAELYDPATARVHINPTGSFIIGGPQGDAGLTGRKIIVDTYGGVGRHGGGAFSGKDATKVDRSGAYAARWAARTVVAAGLARRCEIQLAYAIGVAEPVSVWVDSQGTGVEPDERLSKAVAETFDFRPRGIIEELKLRSPIYSPTSAYGHFGRSPESVSRFDRTVQLFPWERLDRVDRLRAWF